MSSPKIHRIAGAQVDSAETIGASLEKALLYIRKAARARADFLLFPEMYLTGYTANFPRVEAEEALEEIGKAAAKYGVHVLMGTGGQRADGTVNQVRIFSRKGELVGVHEKIHCQSEKDYVPGKALRTYTVDGLCFAVLICNDFWATPRSTWGRVPLLVQEAQDLGATLIFHAISCGNEPDPVKREIIKAWHVAAHRMWAMRIGLTIVAANEPRSLGSLVNSGVVGPDGQYLVKAPNRGERFFVAEVPIPFSRKGKAGGRRATPQKVRSLG